MRALLLLLNATLLLAACDPKPPKPKTREVGAPVHFHAATAPRLHHHTVVPAHTRV